MGISPAWKSCQIFISLWCEPWVVLRFIVSFDQCLEEGEVCLHLSRMCCCCRRRKEEEGQDKATATKITISIQLKGCVLVWNGWKLRNQFYIYIYILKDGIRLCWQQHFFQNFYQKKSVDLYTTKSRLIYIRNFESSDTVLYKTV